MDGKVDYGPSPQTSAGGPDAAAQFYTSKYIRDGFGEIRSRCATLGVAYNSNLYTINVVHRGVLFLGRCLEHIILGPNYQIYRGYDRYRP